MSSTETGQATSGGRGPGGRRRVGTTGPLVPSPPRPMPRPRRPGQACSAPRGSPVAPSRVASPPAVRLATAGTSRLPSARRRPRPPRAAARRPPLRRSPSADPTLLRAPPGSTASSPGRAASGTMPLATSMPSGPGTACLNLTRLGTGETPGKPFGEQIPNLIIKSSNLSFDFRAKIGSGCCVWANLSVNVGFLGFIGPKPRQSSNAPCRSWGQRAQPPATTTTTTASTSSSTTANSLHPPPSPADYFGPTASRLSSAGSSRSESPLLGWVL